MEKSNFINVFDDKVQVKRGVFTVTVVPVPGERTHAECLVRARQIMTEAGIPKSRYQVLDFRTGDNS